MLIFDKLESSITELAKLLASKWDWIYGGKAHNNVLGFFVDFYSPNPDQGIQDIKIDLESGEWRWLGSLLGGKNGRIINGIYTKNFRIGKRKISVLSALDF